MEDELEEKEDELKELGGEYSNDFSPQSEYVFESMSGKMALLSSSLADDQLLGIFRELAANVKTSELTDVMQGILDKYKPY